MAKLFSGKNEKKDKKGNKDVKDKKTSVLKMELDFKDLKSLPFGKAKGQTVPTKDTMNLVFRSTSADSPAVIIPLAIIVAILIIVFCKFAVIDRLVDLNEAESTLSSSQNLYDKCQNQLGDYYDVKEKYYRYTDAYKTEDELSLIDRADIIDIMDNASAGLGTMQSFSVSGNEVSCTVYAVNLDNVSQIRQRLEGYDTVERVSVYTAQKNSSGNTYVVASVVFNVIKVEEEVTAADEVVIEKTSSELAEDSAEGGDEAYEDSDRTGGE